jgi:hypothetical protein
MMKLTRRLGLLLLVAFLFTMQSCRTWERIFPSKKRGCPTNGKNVGAEQLLDENKGKGAKAARKAKRFRS